MRRRGCVYYFVFMVIWGEENCGVMRNYNSGNKNNKLIMFDEIRGIKWQPL